MERSRILGAGVWMAIGLAAAFAVVSASANRHSTTTTTAPAAKATVAQAPACCAQDVKAAPVVAAVAPRAAKPLVRASAGVNGLVIALDPESGELGMPSGEQMAQLEAAQQLLPSDELNHSSAGLTPVYHADGSVSVDLQGRFQEFATLRLDAGGKKVFGCTTDPSKVGDTANPNSAPSGLEEK